MLNVQTILIPADFSDCSQAAFQVARALARDYRARLLVLHIAEPPPFVTPGELERALQRQDGYRSELEDRLRQLYSSDSLAGVEYRVLDGDPAVEILAVTRESGCDLIVMGTQGRTGLGRMLLGSVAEKVVRNAVCPVLTVKVPLKNTPASLAPIPEQAGQSS
jgi:nucleotide-binding universal stress UspA family protein